jgi:hypothetical protein
VVPASASTRDQVSLSDPESPDPIADEAWVLHMALFGLAPPPAVARRYRTAIRSILGEATTADPGILRFRERPSDLEILELILRQQDRTNALTVRAHVMLYVAECRRDHLDHFVLATPQPVRAAVALGLAVLRTAWLYWRGRSAAGTQRGR